MIHISNFTLLVIFLIIVIIATKLDYELYQKLDKDYKKYLLKDTFKEKYYSSNSIIRFIRNIEIKTNRNKNKKIIVVGFIILIILIILMDVLGSNFIKILDYLYVIFIGCVIVIALKSAIHDMKLLKEYREAYNKHNSNIEMLYIIIGCAYFVISTILATMLIKRGI